MTSFIRYTEYCDHEGEKWTFWLQREGNEAALAELEQILEAAENAANIDEGYYEPQFRLPGDLEPEAIVDKLIEYADTGYFASHNKVTGTLDPTSLRNKHWEDVNCILYKGGITRLFTKAAE